MREGTIWPCVRYVGVDLAWKEKAGRDRTAVAVLDGNGRLIDVVRADTDSAIVDAVLAAGRPAIVGVDAPLVVPNRGSCRQCERALIRAGVPVYPANRAFFEAHYGGCRGELIKSALEGRGYLYIDGSRLNGGDAVVEVYPYTLWRTLFRTVPPYKRGRKVERVPHLRTMCGTLLGLLAGPASQDAIAALGPMDLEGLTRGELDRIGDAIDAVAAALTMWDLAQVRSGRVVPARGVRLFGDLESGYILASWPPADLRPAAAKDY